jgi:ribosome-binding protein aMBF1 (putative translation factor)
VLENLSLTTYSTRPIAEEVDIADLLRRMITGRQIRMARAALGWTAAELAHRSGVSASAIQRAEAAGGMPTMKSTNLFKLQRALEIGGVQFIDADETGGEGVRRRR